MMDPSATPRVSGMRSFFRGARTATTLLTRIPLPPAAYSAADWRWAIAWLPVVGAGIGCVLAGVWVVARPVGATPAAVLVLVASTFLTGALHEDGLADTADAQGGAHTRERIFEILKDSRVGAFGAIALALSILLRVTLLARIGDGAGVALVMVHSLARLSPPWMLAVLPYVTPLDQSRNRAVTGAGWVQTVAATLGAVLVMGALVAAGFAVLPTVVTAIGGVGAATMLLAWYFKFRAGGVTGDFLGAAEQASECVVLIALVARH